MGLPLSQVRLYLMDILKALHYCHKIAKVIHRDIKPDNIMLNHNDEAVLIDFGVSAIVEQDDILDSNMGSYMFFAPEMFMRSDKTLKVRGEQTDIWALGITFYYLITGVYPCEDARNPMHLRDLIHERDINFDLIKNTGARNILMKIL
jgi:non-specific serine/threonine protein kinase